MEIDIMFEINTNNSSANRREGTDLDTPSEFIKKQLILGVQQLATQQLKEVLTKENRDGKHLSGNRESDQKKRKKMENK